MDYDYSDYAQEEEVEEDPDMTPPLPLSTQTMDATFVLEPASIDPTWEYLVRDMFPQKRDAVKFMLMGAHVTSKDGVLWVGLPPGAEWLKPHIETYAKTHDVKLEWMK